VQALVWLGRAAQSFARAHVHLTFDRKDPWPSILAFAGKLPGLSRITRKLSRRRHGGRAKVPRGPSPGLPSTPSVPGSRSA
jgi:hypothetical protein